MNEKEQLVSFIKEQLGQGLNAEAIKKLVKAQGWLDTDIEQAFAQAMNELAGMTSVPNVPSPAVAASPVYANSIPTMTIQPAGGSVIGKILTVVVALILIGAASAGAYFGYNYYQGTQTSLSGAIINTINALVAGKIKSGEVSLIAAVTVKEVGSNYSDLATDDQSKQVVSQLEDVAFNFNYSGIINQTNDGKFETSGDLSASVKNPNGGNLGMFGSQELGLKYKTFSDNIYLNIQKLPAITAMLLPPTIDTTKYLNQWFSVPIAVADQYSQAYTGNVNASTTEEVKNQIINIFDKSDAFTVTDKKSEKTDKGTAVTAMYLKVDLDKLGSEIIRLNKIESEKSGITFTNSQELEMRTNIEKIKELPIANGVVKVLVGADGYVYGYVLSGDLMDKNNKLIGNYNNSFTVDNINQSFTIDKPANARSLNEVMMEIDSLMNSSTKVK